MLRAAVIATGIVSALLLLFPFLVNFGLMVLIVPGIVMMAIPTIFVHLALALLLRTLLPLPGGALSSIVCLALAVALGWAVMQPWRLIERARHDALYAEDVIPPQGLEPSGDVVLERPERNARRDGPPGCDPLCLALLELPAVDSVTPVSDDAAPVTYRIGGAALGEPVRPVRPGRLLAAFRELDRAATGRAPTRSSADEEALASAGAALRLAGERTLRRAASPRVADPDWVVRYTYRRERGEPWLQRLEITGPGGRVRARLSVLEHEIPARFFHLAFVGGGSNEGWEIGTERLETGGWRDGIDPAVALLRVVAIERPAIAGDELKRLREAVVDALADPHASPQALALAETWVELLGLGDVNAKLPLLARILEDERIAVPHELLDRWLSRGSDTTPGERTDPDLSPLRRGLVRRLHRSDDPKARTTYAGLLVDMPEGTFASPTEEERAVWRSSLSLQEGSAFVERMADLGEAAVPELLGLIESALAEPWHRRRRTLAGVREAFKRLGPLGETAVPVILPLLAQPDPPLVSSADDRLQWLVALARLGVPIAELPYLAGKTAEWRAAEEARVRRALERYETARASRTTGADESR